MDKTYPCSRCDGSGNIKAFGHVLGGICFKCHGTGTQKSRPSSSAKWVVLDDNGRDVYNVTAQTAAKAVAKALITFSRASEAFRSEHGMKNPTAVPSEEYWTKERLDAMEASR